jgi:phage baseplate assembly protein V
VRESRNQRFRQRMEPFQRGFVEEVNVNGTVRVKFPQHQNLVSFWLTVIYGKTQDDKDFWLPDLGEQVACIMDQNLEDGVVLGAVYSSVDVPPAGATVNTYIKSFSDGTVIKYDRASHALTAALGAGGTANVAAPGGMTLNGVTIDTNGNVHSPGTITGDTDVIAAGISGKGHEHTSEPPGNPTSPPIA